ncbi:MAG: binding-protein-dependent transport system inner rane component [Firmicutes bacterium]|nr:binding-protein-dependent transport system inner rane component [Bacillota bacterium]
MGNRFAISDLALSWSIPFIVLIFWYAITLGQSSMSLFPPPGDVGIAVGRLIKDGTLAKNLEISSMRAIMGFVIGGLIGFLLGVVNGQFRLAEAILNTPIQMIRNVPHLAMMPLILIWFGIGETAKIVLISLGTFFPIYLNTFHGIRYVDKSLIEMGKTYGLTRFEVFKDIIFPGALSSIMIGVRQSLGRMWLTLIVAETVAAKSGIGFMATNAREFMLMDVIVLSLLIYAVLGSISDLAAGVIEKRVLRWHPNYRKA